MCIKWNVVGDGEATADKNQERQLMVTSVEDSDVDTHLALYQVSSLSDLIGCLYR